MRRYSDKDGCRLNLPYPPVTVSGRNQGYAELLSQDYSGAKSEMTAINQYVYQHIITGEVEKELSDALACISQVEMLHMEMLGELIRDLGGDPRMGGYEGRDFVYWSGRYPSYKTNRRQILTENIRGEEAAIAAYRERILQIDDRNIKRILERIILDEQEHIKIFREFLERT